MDAEEVLKLFDCYWFGHEIFTKPPLLTNPDPRIQNEPIKPELSSFPTRHVRSLSDQLSSNTSSSSDSLSPNSVLPTHKLQTILSGKEVSEESPKQEQVERVSKKVMKGRRRKKGTSKSLSDLEFEELKGFMDLGFVFSEEDKNSTLASVIPGLHRLGKKIGEEETFDESAIPRPYLSEAWNVLDRRKEQNPLLNWRIPSLCSEIDMKDHLRCWARTVASAVR